MSKNCASYNCDPFDYTSMYVWRYYSMPEVDNLRCKKIGLNKSNINPLYKGDKHNFTVSTLCGCECPFDQTPLKTPEFKC
jgi:hypothetical protein